jgi:enamine deaminase RidA (YjgF/YER057c/UK114 family)
MSHDKRIVELKLELPPPPKPAGTYLPTVRVGNLLHVAGHGPLRPNATLITGRVGQDMDLDAGYQAARQVGLTMLATLKHDLGSLDKIGRLIKTLGMVNATADFHDHPKVINGFSDLMVEVFGQQGRGARSAVGMVSLPGNIAVEVEAIFELVD